MQVPPPVSNPQPPATNGQLPQPSSNLPQVAPISWEGDRIFNVYIHDYFRKRGFHKAAKELVLEADIGNDASPPINARQGFLFEWWNVFWMFFAAKTTGQGPDNVMLYFHWMQSQQAERTRQLQHETEQRRAAAQLPLTTQGPPPQAARPPMARPPLNGVNIGVGVRPPMVNGVPPAPGPAQYPMTGGPPPPTDPSRPPSDQQARRAGPRDMRPPGAFPSPTMTSAAPPSQFLARPPGTVQTPAQPYMNHTGPPPPPPAMASGPASRSATPGNGHPLTQQSPAMASREPPPQGPGIAINEEMSRRFQQQHQQQQQTPQQQQPTQQQPGQQQPNPPHQPPRLGGVQMTDEVTNLEASLQRIPPVFLAQMKMEAGLSDREITTLTYEERARLNTVFKKTMENYNGTTFPPVMGRNGRPTGPSQPQPMSGMPMYPPHAPPVARQPSGSGPAPRGQKRGSTSPTDEGSADKDQSPPDKKRLRPSPPAPPMGSMVAGFPYGGGPAPVPQQQQPPPQQQQSLAAMRHPQVPPPAMAHMGLPTQPIMGHPLAGPSGPNQGQIQQQQLYRQTMATQHLGKIPSGMVPPAPSATQNRAPPAPPQQGKMMPPPPSPAQQKASGPEKTAPSPASRPDAASPSMRPTSSGGPPGAGGNGGPATPGAGTGASASAGGAAAPTRISPSAAMNSLPRPQTSEGPTGTGSNGPPVTQTSAQAQTSAPAPPPPPAPPATTTPAMSIGNDMFSTFFDTMDDQFGIDSTFTDALDTSELSQWIDMNPLG